MRLESTIIEDENHIGSYHFISARNDPILNNYRKNHWLQMHRADMDVKACFTKYAMVSYLTKYATKNEPSSDPFKDITGKIVHQTVIAPDQVAPQASSAFTKFLMNSTTNFDISAQDVVHHAMQIPALNTIASFAYASLNQWELDSVKKTASKSHWQKYTERNVEQTYLSLDDYVSDYSLDRHNKLKHLLYLEFILDSK